jgi:hypothetical protein
MPPFASIVFREKKAIYHNQRLVLEPYRENQNLYPLSQNIQRKTKMGASFELHKLKI